MDEWKRELRKQGPVPSSTGQRSAAPSSKEGLDLSDVKNLISQSIKESSGKVSATGTIEVELAPIARFPWEVRFVINGSGTGVVRVYKGIIVDTGGGAYETRNAHVKYRSGRSTTPIKLQGDNVSSPGDYDWISTVDQRDPMAVPPEGNGIQISWPPQYIGGSTTSAVASSKKDPEPIDGGIPFATRGVNIGKQGYGASGADGMPWFDFSYVEGLPIYLACKKNELKQNEFGIFAGSAGMDMTSEGSWWVLIAHVTSNALIHQYFRSDLTIGPYVPPGGTTGQVLTKQSDNDWDADWETPEGGGPSNDWDHPFRVKSVIVGEESSAFTLIPGTVNNVAVTPSGGISIPGLPPFKCYIEITWSGTPKTVTAVGFISSTATLNSDDTVARVLIAEVQAGGTVNQYVTGSLWTDRIKVAGADARYYFARI